MPPRSSPQTSREAKPQQTVLILPLASDLRRESWTAIAVPSKARGIPVRLARFVTLGLGAGVSLRDVQDAAGHADPRTTRRYDRARYNLDRHPTYALSGFVG